MEYQYDSIVSQERGVMIDDDTGVSWWSLDITNGSQPWSIRNNFCFGDLSQKCHLGHQEGGVTIDDDTGVILMESLDIQHNISGWNSHIPFMSVVL